jgi:hypothetical protein
MLATSLLWALGNADVLTIVVHRLGTILHVVHGRAGNWRGVTTAVTCRHNAGSKSCERGGLAECFAQPHNCCRSGEIEHAGHTARTVGWWRCGGVLGGCLTGLGRYDKEES